MDQAARRQFLIDYLLQEAGETVAVPPDAARQRTLLRALLNLRPPQPASEAFLQVQDEYLRREIAAKGITDVCMLTPLAPGMALWQGDITTLRCDAIVNAANSGMTGCYHPNHGCIDNAIHTYAGVQLRQECARLMEAQGALEPCGRAKITPGYNLPARYILHTVGPIVEGQLTARHETQLADCYRACLSLAAARGLETLAFCCISTGEYHFPNHRAADIAVATVCDFLSAPSSVQMVVFNVFKDSDRMIYEQLLGM